VIRDGKVYSADPHAEFDAASGNYTTWVDPSNEAAGKVYLNDVIIDGDQTLTENSSAQILPSNDGQQYVYLPDPNAEATAGNVYTSQGT
jgi:hypothetical protein